MPSPSLNSSRIRIFAVFATLVLAMTSLTRAAVHEHSTSAMVEYIAADRIYLSVGAVDEIHEGDELELQRNHDFVAKVRVVQISDHNASTIIIEKKRAVRQGDSVVVPVKKTHIDSIEQVPDYRRHRTAVTWDDMKIKEEWTHTLISTPPSLIPYDRKQNKRPQVPAGPAIQGGTQFRQYSYFQHSRYSQSEQTVQFSAHAENQWLSGLSWTINGAAYARYDNNSDGYMENRHFIPLIQNLSVAYQSSSRLLSFRFGRFTPSAPIVHVIDGLQTKLETQNLSFVCFGGLQPDEQDIAFTTHRQTFGMSSRWSARNSSSRYIESAIIAGMYKGSIYRTAVGINSRFDHSSGFYLTESAVIDFLSAKNSTQSGTDPALANATMYAAWPLTPTLQLDANARYSRNVLFQQDFTDLPDQWISSLEQTGVARMELGMPLKSKRNHYLRPFLFGLGEHRDNQFERILGGAGFSHHNDRLFSSRTGITTSIDYGIGKGQIANIDVSLNTPLQKNRLDLLSGLYTTWSWVWHSDVHTLRNLAFLVLQGHIHKNIDITANWYTGYDHALVRLTYPLGVWMQFQLGVSAYY